MRACFFKGSISVLCSFPTFNNTSNEVFCASNAVISYPYCYAFCSAMAFYNSNSATLFSKSPFSLLKYSLDNFKMSHSSSKIRYPYWSLSKSDKVASYFLFDYLPTFSSFLKTSFILSIFPLYYSMVSISLCWCNCNFWMYSLVFLIYCNPMFIPGCICNVFESCHAPIFQLRDSIM